ncbi:hypothetical protein CPB84DRAFT_1781227 [Gymnopilus junonius]|uniref:DUF6533 domain-containing protein n=1 Tax=Gymnopilus junonius TaxID=109634 RepID=A0A9P5NMX5_GYMJU|nr:hypothetical protein CPB84DRAFT_1781227 [Gymnopilus junonius]
MSDGSQSSPPNPSTPLAFLPPDLAYQVTVAIYVLVASLAILIWDFISNLKADIRMLTRYRVTPSIFVYFISRFSSLAYLLAFTIILTAPLQHCDNFPRVAVLYAVAIPSTSLLFLFRVASLYTWNKTVAVLFSVLWLAVVGTTHYCRVDSHLEPYVALSCITLFVYNLLVFSAAGWRLLYLSEVEPSIANDSIKVKVFGRYLPAFSRAVLEDGQAHYLATVTLNLVTTALFLDHSFPVIYRSFIGVPNLVVMNTMACHVYRQIKFGVYRNSKSDPLFLLGCLEPRPCSPLATPPPPTRRLTFLIMGLKRRFNTDRPTALQYGKSELDSRKCSLGHGA